MWFTRILWGAAFRCGMRAGENWNQLDLWTPIPTTTKINRSAITHTDRIPGHTKIEQNFRGNRKYDAQAAIWSFTKNYIDTSVIRHPFRQPIIKLCILYLRIHVVQTLGPTDHKTSQSASILFIFTTNKSLTDYCTVSIVQPVAGLQCSRVCQMTQGGKIEGAAFPEH